MINCVSQNTKHLSRTWVGSLALANMGYLGFPAVISLAAFRSGAWLSNTRCRRVFDFSEGRMQREQSCFSGACHRSLFGANAGSRCLSAAIWAAFGLGPLHSE